MPGPAALLPAQYYRDFDQHLSEFMGPNPETGINLDLTLVGEAGRLGGAGMWACMVLACGPAWCWHVGLHGAGMWACMVLACGPAWCCRGRLRSAAVPARLAAGWLRDPGALAGCAVLAGHMQQWPSVLPAVNKQCGRSSPLHCTAAARGGHAPVCAPYYTPGSPCCAHTYHAAPPPHHRT